MVYPFHVLMLSENQVAEDAEQYRCRQQETGDFIDKPEESPETDDGDRRPYRRYASRVQVTEHDGCDNSQ